MEALFYPWETESFGPAPPHGGDHRRGGAQSEKRSRPCPGLSEDQRPGNDEAEGGMMDVTLDRLKEVLNRARQEVAKVIIGQEEVIDRALLVIFTNHHALVEGVPGIAKTLLVRTLAHVLGCEFNRIQFTPDLMPADIVGTN